MNQFKVSKLFTEGQKILILCLGLSLLLIMFKTTAQAQDTVEETSTTSVDAPNGVTININGGDSQNAEEEKTNSCESIEKSLADKLRDMSKACQATNIVEGCFQSLFECQDGLDSENCISLQSALSSKNSQQSRIDVENQKDALKELEDKKEKLQEKQEEAQKQVNELNSKYEDKIRELSANDKELSAQINENRALKDSKISELQNSVRNLESQNQQIFAAISAQQTEMNKFMLQERLNCRAKAQEKAQNYYKVLRACAEGRFSKPCSMSFNSFVRNGGRSYADMAKSYERKQNRECLRVDSDSEFALKYKAMHAQIDENKSVLARQQDTINKQRLQITNEIKLAQANGSLAESKLVLNNAETAKILSNEKNRIQLQIMAKNEEVKNYTTQIKALQDQADIQSEALADARLDMATSLDSDSLGSLRDAYANKDSLISEASYAVTNNGCECNGSLQRISDLSGQGFCGTSTDTEVTGEEIEYVDSVDSVPTGN